MKRILFALVVAVASGSAAASKFNELEWSTSSKARLESLGDLSKSVTELVLGLLPDADIDPPRVGEFLFSDLDGDGQLELLVTLDHSGRGFFNSVMVIQRASGKYGYSMTHVNTNSVVDLSSRVVDVDQNGRHELVVEQFIDRYEGATRTPVETVIFELHGAALVDASSRYPEFYRDRVIPKLEKELKASEEEGSTRLEVDDYNSFVLKAEIRRAKLRAGVKDHD